MEIKTPLRYPGGKSRAVKQILEMIPEFEEFREPMVGGGSVFIRLKQEFPKKKYWINDVDQNLMLFWKYCKEDPKKLISVIKRFRKKYSVGKELYKKIKVKPPENKEIIRASRFFILNRITFSGLIESGGYSEESFIKRFTESSLDRIKQVGQILNQVRVTSLDYSKVISKKGKNVFIFLDPPYISNKYSALYGKNGSIHKNFDHEKFAKEMKKCKHRWLITYDDCERARELFSFAKIKEWNLRYGMKTNGHTQPMGKELFIYNY